MIRTPLLAALLCSPCALAQLPLSLQFSFVDTDPGGTGNLGVTQDEVTFDYFLVAFQNTQTVHRFDPAGQPVATYTTTGCSPALQTPNDITYDPFTTDLWLVDNAGGKNVLRFSRSGACLGGWQIPVNLANPVGICVDRNRGSLFISYDGGTIECDRDGNQLGGGFSFLPPSGPSILSGITYVPETDRFLITQSGGSSVYEVNRTGGLISTTPLASFGIGNTQGLHYNPALQTLTVVDNSLSTAFVFSMVLCSGTTVHRGVGCQDSGGRTVVIGATGCPDLGTTVMLEALASPGPLPMLFAGGTSDTVAGGMALPVDLGLLGGPAGCWIHTSSETVLASPNVNGTATLPLAIPSNPALSGAQIFLQSAVLDGGLSVPLPLATGNYLALTLN